MPTVSVRDNENNRYKRKGKNEERKKQRGGANWSNVKWDPG